MLLLSEHIIGDVFLVNNFSSLQLRPFKPMHAFADIMFSLANKIALSANTTAIRDSVCRVPLSSVKKLLSSKDSFEGLKWVVLIKLIENKPNGA